MERVSTVAVIGSAVAIVVVGERRILRVCACVKTDGRKPHIKVCCRQPHRKKLLIQKDFLENWYENSFENRDWYVKEHPWISQAIPIRKFKTATGEIEEPEGIDLSQFVIVHFAGKSLLLKRDQLDKWYHESPEDRAEFVRSHPESEIKFD